MAWPNGARSFNEGPDRRPGLRLPRLAEAIAKLADREVDIGPDVGRDIELVEDRQCFLKQLQRLVCITFGCLG